MVVSQASPADVRAATDDGHPSARPKNGGSAALPPAAFTDAPTPIRRGEVHSDDPLRVVLCGSFRRDREGLVEAFDALQSRHELLSPLSLNFVDLDADFVRLPHEVGQDATTIEEQHLAALSEADFVWLHAPDGYIGASAMFELGHAKALGIPIFSSSSPAEDTYRPWVTVVSGPHDVELSQDLKAPGSGLRGLQRYYERTCSRRGWSEESVQDTLLLMTEELGELARAVRKSMGLSRDQDWKGEDVATELADLQLYLVHLSNGMGIDLAEAVTEKESVNAARVAARFSVA